MQQIKIMKSIISAARGLSNTYIVICTSLHIIKGCKDIAEILLYSGTRINIFYFENKQNKQVNLKLYHKGLFE